MHRNKLRRDSYSLHRNSAISSTSTRSRLFSFHNSPVLTKSSSSLFCLFFFAFFKPRMKPTCFSLALSRYIKNIFHIFTAYLNRRLLCCSVIFYTSSNPTRKINISEPYFSKVQKSDFFCLRWGSFCALNFRVDLKDCSRRVNAVMKSARRKLLRNLESVLGKCSNRLTRFATFGTQARY